MSPSVDDYLRRLERELRRLGLDDADILEEARDHLIDAVDAGMKRGMVEEDAEREALDRFGAPELIAAHAAAERNRMANRLAAALQTIWARKWWIVAPTIAAAAVTSVLSWYLLPTRFRANTLILVVPQRVEYPPSTAGGSPRMVSQFSNSRERLERIGEWILTRTRLERIISDFDLFKDERPRTPMEYLVERMRRDIAVTLHSPGGVDDDDVAAFSVSFTSSDPRLALGITQRLASVIIDEHLREREVLAEGANQFLESQIEDVRERIAAHEATLNEQRARSRGRPPSQADLVPYEALLDRYRVLLMQKEDSRTVANIERRQIGEQFRVLDPARLPLRPVGPSRQEVNVAGTMAGLALGLVMIVVRRKSR